MIWFDENEPRRMSNGNYYFITFTRRQSRCVGWYYHMANYLRQGDNRHQLLCFYCFCPFISYTITQKLSINFYEIFGGVAYMTSSSWLDFGGEKRNTIFVHLPKPYIGDSAHVRYTGCSAAESQSNRRRLVVVTTALGAFHTDSAMHLKRLEERHRITVLGERAACEDCHSDTDCYRTSTPSRSISKQY